MTGKSIVAIVGRPNVGKSTLFNRLVGENRAITEDIPGTTRDRIYADVSWGDHEFVLVDTGGLELRPDIEIAQRVRQQVQTAIAEADVILFMVDVRDGVTVIDLELAEALRASGKPLVPAANKADNPRRRDDAVAFFELGIGEPLPVSAYHSLGMDELLARVVRLLPLPTAPSFTEEGALKIAIVGRPNVGKSSLLNAILGEERAIVSAVPGTTRDALDTPFHYQEQPLLLIDTAGIRRQGSIEPGIERYGVIRALRAVGRADVAVLLIDAAEGITAQDTHIAGYISEAAKGIILAINKWDLAPKLGLNEPQFTRQIHHRLRFMPYAPILYISAMLGQGIKAILKTATVVAQERRRRVPTARLNTVISEACLSHSPPSRRGRQLKVYFATQVQVDPPTFVFFVNDPKLVHFSYQRYLENQLRQAFGFQGAPVRLTFKARREE